MTRPFFTKDRISHFDIFDRHALRTLDILRARLASGYAIDFQDLVSRFTLDSATEYLFGHDIRSLDGTPPYPYGVTPPPFSTRDQDKTDPDRFPEAFGAAQLKIAVRVRLGEKWPLVEFWKDQVKELRDVCKEVLEPVLDEAIRKRRELPREKGEEAETLLEHLLDYTQGQGTMGKHCFG